MNLLSLIKDSLRLFAFAIGSSLAIAWSVVFWVSFFQTDKWTLVIGFNRFGEAIIEGILLHIGAMVSLWAMLNLTRRLGRRL